MHRPVAGGKVDFSEEGRKLLEAAGLLDVVEGPAAGKRRPMWRHLDLVYCRPKSAGGGGGASVSTVSGSSDADAAGSTPAGGAGVFIGDQSAASSREMLREHGIGHVVNCTSGAFHAAVWVHRLMGTSTNLYDTPSLHTFRP